MALPINVELYKIMQHSAGKIDAIIKVDTEQ
jgi:hypothetical protein